MTSWKEYVILVLPQEIQVYERPDYASFGKSHCASLISIYPLAFVQRPFITSFVAEAQVVDPAMWDQSISELDQTFPHLSLQIFMRDDRAILHLLRLTYNTDAIPTFTLSRLLCDQPEGVARCEYMDQIIVGSSGTKILFRHSAHSPVSRMSLADIRVPALPRESGVITESESFIVQNHRYISVEHLPQLQFHSCTDFDDARGIFVAGNSRGDLCIGRFVEEQVLSATSVVDSLPDAEGLPAEQNCVQMDLPIYYEYANAVVQGELPSPLSEAITQSWGLVDGRPFLVPVGPTTGIDSRTFAAGSYLTCVGIAQIYISATPEMQSTITLMEKRR
ncbi:hypothetical protein BD410DRAFT_472803 [Rickenella mellea]|uniref:Uncharacterized protein n=1 Tax=Rickenella mellea TaxID=50990 RepID=A0A4Y7QID1_9AGAM|nr:hypothetical protein BD410DRAFT_472803 [Rickenella mellea]